MTHTEVYKVLDFSERPENVCTVYVESDNLIKLWLRKTATAQKTGNMQQGLKSSMEYWLREVMFKN